MPTITIDVPENKELDILEYLSSFDYIKIRDRKNIKNKFKNKLINSLKEVELMEEDIIEKNPIEEFLEELRNEKFN
ncbi:MAG: hypothetical protein WCR42_15885 [bacterium]